MAFHQALPDCAAIHEEINAMPDGLDLSDPATFTRLPFTSLPLCIPSQCFDTKVVNGIGQFEYMGRSKFRELRNHIENHKSLYPHGTSGSGKSHLLAALAYQLTREGERVFYVPDCAKLLLHPKQAMWTAFRFVFNYDSASLGNIGIPTMSMH